MGGTFEVQLAGTCAENCCECCGVEGSNLTITLENISNCEDLDGATATLTWNPALPAPASAAGWEGTVNLPNCSESWDFQLACIGLRETWDDFRLYFLTTESECDIGSQADPSSGSCDPFELIFDLDGCTNTGCCNGAPKRYRVRITE